MDGPEGDLWDWFRSRIIKQARDEEESQIHQEGRWKLKFERVENVVGEGIPDVHYVVHGSTGWIELKSVTLRLDPAVPVLPKGKGVRESQVNWHMEHAACHGTSWLLIEGANREGSTIWLLPGMYAAQANDLTAAQMTMVATFVRKKNEWNRVAWNRVLRILSRSASMNGALFKEW